AERPPDEEPALRTQPMPADANVNGDIFGGWVLSQMDLAGAVPAAARAAGRIATVAVEAMRFHKPIFVGDLVSCYARVVRSGTTSVTVVIEPWPRRRLLGEEVKVTEGTFIYVAIDEQGRPRPLPPLEAEPPPRRCPQAFKPAAGTGAKGMECHSPGQSQPAGLPKVLRLAVPRHDASRTLNLLGILRNLS